jgi:hypothetical protein
VPVWLKKSLEDCSSLGGIAGKPHRDDALPGRRKLLTNWLVLQRYQKKSLLRQFAMLSGLINTVATLVTIRRTVFADTPA